MSTYHTSAILLSDYHAKIPTQQRQICIYFSQLYSYVPNTKESTEHQYRF